MADYSAVALSWFQAATELTPPTEEELFDSRKYFKSGINSCKCATYFKAS